MKYVPILFVALLSFGCVKAEDKPAPHGGHAGFHKEANASMHKMHEGMMTMKSTGSADKDFAAMMAKHHEGAVEMSQAYLKHAKDEDLRKMATKMIEDQKKEIEMLKAKL